MCKPGQAFQEAVRALAEAGQIPVSEAGVIAAKAAGDFDLKMSEIAAVADLLKSGSDA